MVTRVGTQANTFPTPPAPPVTTQSKDQSSVDRAGLNQNFDQFLLLLTTQLKNQDPLSPMDSTQFTNQLVSFSGVEQQIKMNASLSKMLALSNANQTTLALGYIGLNVDMEGSQFGFDGQSMVKMSYTMPDNASSSIISILDKNNNVVYSQPGDNSKGTHEFLWAGVDQNGAVAEPGAYEIRVGALDQSQKAMTVNTIVPGLVHGIETEDDGNIMLLINGQKVPMDSVKKASL